jgi:hypothetical protein
MWNVVGAERTSTSPNRIVIEEDLLGESTPLEGVNIAD